MFRHEFKIRFDQTLLVLKAHFLLVRIRKKLDASFDFVFAMNSMILIIRKTHHGNLLNLKIVQDLPNVTVVRLDQQTQIFF